jgi:magnesium transporter
MQDENEFENNAEDILENKIEHAYELIENKDFQKLKELLAELEPADIAMMLEEVPIEKVPLIFRILPKELAADTFVEMDSDQQEVLIRAFSDEELEQVMRDVFVDDTVDIIEEMPANVVRRILKSISPERRAKINDIMHYPEDSAGSIMTIEYVDLTESMTVADAFDKIRETGLNKETIYTCYVIDGNRKLKGLVTVMTLLTSPQEAVIADIMDENVIFTTTDADKEDVSKLIEKYDLLAIPVVDLEHRLVGIVTVDDAIDVIQEEAEEDFAKMNAITPMEKPYLKTSVFNIWKSRIPWLMLMMVSATFTGMIISSFESALAKVVILTSFIPMLMDTGGNSGSQASVTIIRGLSLGEIEFSDILRVIWKEARVSILCGISLAVATFLKIMLINNLLLHENVDWTVALVVCITMALTIVIAKFIGCTLPLLAKKIGFDPAVMASPFITTIVDAVSLLIYFSVATSILPGI